MILVSGCKLPLPSNDDPSTITDGKWDLLYAVSDQKIELYRTKEDPGHKNDLSKNRPDMTQRLYTQFVAWLEDLGTSEDKLDPRRKL